MLKDEGKGREKMEREQIMKWDIVKKGDIAGKKEIQTNRKNTYKGECQGCIVRPNNMMQGLSN